MLTHELHFDLPDELIATQPAEPRDSAKLMVINRANQSIAHHHVRDLPDLGFLKPNDLMIVNQTQVLMAHWTGTRTATGGHVSGLYLQPSQTGNWITLIQSRGKLQPNEIITLTENARLKLLHKTAPSGTGGEWEALYESDNNTPTVTLLQQIGTTPLPPYIRRARKHHHQPEVTDYDKTRYNTVYAQNPGSVAAPTAGLHFTPELLATLEQQNIKRTQVTLNIGMGTFAPVRSENLEDHDIHTESFSITRQALEDIQAAHAAGNRVFPVGTTTVRALESLPATFPDTIPPLETNQTYSTDTSLFITPQSGHTFRFTDSLLTNFHLPNSTLLALVAALPNVGLSNLKNWYQTAIDHDYRFYSYGDAMLII
ncbi:tRNA preQ1(34) S-adenosylmethionine ribosyltransferase-isomerase QueA [Poriferisphaera sp. WC338]|uniref:tRNA preQ1(34) S-adenosylmethionine ribosyltransferase-isomerase QueA n=1 Tax=Poriferisphaera sp. WC338 TaxID=3425129 RepID=UPI003D818B6A